MRYLPQADVVSTSFVEGTPQGAGNRPLQGIEDRISLALDGGMMRSYLYRVSVVSLIVGLALIGRGIGMQHEALLWTGIALAGGNILLLLCYRRASTPPSHPAETPSADTSN